MAQFLSIIKSRLFDCLLVRDLRGSFKQVISRKVGKERLLSAIENTWESFFLSDEFLTERAAQTDSIREVF